MTNCQNASEHIINRLPYQLCLFLLRRITAINGFQSLQNLLLAVPQLSKYVLLIVDHPDEPYKFIPIRTLRPVSLSSFYGQAPHEISYRLSDVIVISSFMYCEERCFAELDYYLGLPFHVLYRSIAKLSLHVIVLHFESFSMGSVVIRPSLLNPHIVQYPKQAPKGWIHFLSGTDNALCEGRLSRGRRRFVFPKGTFSKLISRLSGIHLSHCPLLTTMSASISTYEDFFCREDFLFVRTVKINVDRRCCRIKEWICDGAILLFRAPKVSHLTITYTGCHPPLFSANSRSIERLASDNDPANAVFQMLNTQWYLSAAIEVPPCKNKLDLIGPTCRDLSGGSTYSIPFLKRFHTVILKGIPANLLAVMDLTEARTLLWMRYIDHTRHPPFPDQCHVLTLSNLTHLTLHSIVKSQWDSSFAPRVLLYAPRLTEINLLALHHSTEVWQPRSIFVRRQEFTMGGISLLLAGRLPFLLQPEGFEYNSMKLEAKHITYVATYLKNLMVADYVPLFLFEPQLVFPKLERLTVDISEVSYSLVNSKRSLSIVITDDRFPRLEALTLTLSMTGSISSNLQSLNITLADSVKRLQFMRFLAGALETLIVNGVNISSSLQTLSPPTIMARDHLKVVSWNRTAHTEPFAREPEYSEPEIYDRCSKALCL